MTGPGAPDLLVVGGGIVGCAVAIEAVRRGASVRLLERDQPGVGATGASAGILSPLYEAEGPGPLFRFGLENHRRYPAFVRRIEASTEWPLGLRRDGLLVANWTADEEELARSTVAWQREAGCRARILDPGEAARIHPSVSREARSYVWLPDEAPR
ncbi:MAG: NAD(P)/FAD-dependent oxidoreductase [Gemmatimonadota bacterium]